MRWTKKGQVKPTNIAFILVGESIAIARKPAPAAMAKTSGKKNQIFQHFGVRPGFRIDT
jgi:hypothetical protein